MRAGSILGLLGSLAVHAGVVALVLLTEREAPAQQPDSAVFPIELTDLGPVPPLGALDGVAGSTAPADATPPPARATATAQPTPHADPTPRPESTRAATTPTSAPTSPTTAATTTTRDTLPSDPEAMREAVRKAMLAPDYVPTTAGSGTAAPPLGSPTGTPNGGGGKPGMSAQYKGILDGWFSSRVALGGLDIPWEELKTLRVTVSISLTPDRQVSGFSIVSSSGNAAYDARVRSSLQSTVGATLPAPSDGSEVPSHITLGFQCRKQERCS